MGKATQSSIYNPLNVPDLVIDGNLNSKCEYRSCSRTKFETNPWWKVTFKYTILVREVIIIRNAGKLLNDVLFLNLHQRKTKHSQ